LIHHRGKEPLWQGVQRGRDYRREKTGRNRSIHHGIVGVFWTWCWGGGLGVVSGGVGLGGGFQGQVLCLNSKKKNQPTAQTAKQWTRHREPDLWFVQYLVEQAKKKLFPSTTISPPWGVVSWGQGPQVLYPRKKGGKN